MVRKSLNVLKGIKATTVLNERKTTMRKHHKRGDSEEEIQNCLTAQNLRANAKVNVMEKKVNEFIECYNCKNLCDCERTYLGGCTDGEVWCKEMNNKEFVEQTKAYKKLRNSFAELENAYLNYWKTMRNELTWRNTKLSFWREICLKYEEKDLLNCYGDIFFIDDHYGDTYVGRRVLWNLELSKEQYEIRCDDENDSDGEYEWTNYEIEVIKD